MTAHWRGEHIEAWRYRTGLRYRTNAARALGISLQTYTKYEFNKLPIPLEIEAKCLIIQRDMLNAPSNALLPTPPQ